VPDRLPEATEAAALRDAGVEVVRVSYPDLHGVCRGKDVAIEAWDGVRDHGIAQTEAIMTVDLRHNVISGFEHGFRDFWAVPDLATLVRAADDSTVAWCLADGRRRDGSPFPLDPRQALRRARERLARHGLAAVLAPELEFYLVEPETWRPYVVRDSSVYTTGALADPEGVVRAIVDASRKLGLRPTVSTQEYGRGQFEINLLHGEALEAADRAFRFKTVVKEVAVAHGLLATFMGQLRDDEGSGFHLHLSCLGADGRNAFVDSADPDGLSDRARQFAAGLLAHLPALTAILNPTVNAYRRFVRDSLAPTHINWGVDNKLAAIRVPAEGGEATRLELRTGDGTANIHLGVAAVLVAGTDGLARELPLVEPVTGNPYELGEKRLGPPLPATLDEALDALAADDVFRRDLGEELCATFEQIKRYELGRWRAELGRVTEWERREYAYHL
jgi:glutamine synthetase